tara:strand:- start:192 stop:926 length:735 start_codon:yes stop_codon:yes gene_type:complete
MKYLGDTNCNKLFVVGPSSDLQLLSFEFLEEKRSQGYKIFSYGDSIKRFFELNFDPDYWTFVDPNTVLHFQNEIISGRFRNTELIVPDLYSLGCKNFYDCGYSSINLERNKNLFFCLEQGFNQNFKKYTKLDFKPVKGIGDQIDYKQNLYVHLRKDLIDFLNPCKFSYNLLPLIFFAFKDCKKFEFLAFGQYNLPRYFNNSSGDYLFYVKCYEQIKSKFIEYIKNNQLDLTFLGNQSYFKELQA